jgi:hypothetical protein
MARPVWQARPIVVVGGEELEAKLLVAMPVVQLVERVGLMVEELVRLGSVPTVTALPGLLLAVLEAEDSNQGPAVRTRAAPEPVARSGLVMFL